MTDLDRALDVLLDEALEPIVDMVLLHEGDSYEARTVDGRVRFGPGGDVKEVEGRNPLGDQSLDRFAGLEAERAALYPSRAENAYPFAYEQVAQIFDSPSAPDAIVIHSAAHNWEDQGGHRGEHGSLDVVQARAPFILSGAGGAQLGMVDRACRLIDVMPTVAALLGVAPHDDGRHLASQDGTVLDDLVEGRAAHAVGLLFDGCNPNVLYAMAEAGEAPNVARLMQRGTTFRYGAMASLPTVTLANHTAIITGTHPGHHGVVHNAWWDRATGKQIITNDPTGWPWAMQWLTEGVETIHEAVHRTWPDAVTVSIDEPADRGATFSTFDAIRRGDRLPRAPRAEDLPHATERFVRPLKDYGMFSRIDHVGVQEACRLWDEGADPRFMWMNFTLTDSAFHQGGPHSDIAEASVRDTDARLGELLAAIERAGAFDDTAFVLVADHGMEESNPEVTGDWDVALRDAGLSFRDEAYGFIYLT